MSWKRNMNESRRGEGLKEEARAGSAAALARRAGIEPDAKQMEMLKGGARQMLVCCSRQWGKSTVAALKALETAEREAGSLVVVAPTERQAGLLVEKVRGMAQAAGIPAKGMASHRAGLRLGNGSRVVGLAEVPKSVRGYSAPRLAVVDEAAFVDDEIFAALRPMLAAVRGRCGCCRRRTGSRGTSTSSGRRAGRRGQGYGRRRRSASGSTRSF